MLTCPLLLLTPLLLGQPAPFRRSFSCDVLCNRHWPYLPSMPMLPASPAVNFAQVIKHVWWRETTAANTYLPSAFFECAIRFDIGLFQLEFTPLFARSHTATSSRRSLKSSEFLRFHHQGLRVRRPALLSIVFLLQAIPAAHHLKVFEKFTLKVPLSFNADSLFANSSAPVTLSIDSVAQPYTSAHISDPAYLKTSYPSFLTHDLLLDLFTCLLFGSVVKIMPITLNNQRCCFCFYSWYDNPILHGCFVKSGDWFGVSN